jgi:hypothetical protein
MAELYQLTLADTPSGEVDAHDRMHGPVFAESRTPSGFERLESDSETGTAVWPGNAELTPDTLHGRVRAGVWPEQHLTA